MVTEIQSHSINFTELSPDPIQLFRVRTKTFFLPPIAATAVKDGRPGCRIRSGQINSRRSFDSTPNSCEFPHSIDFPHSFSQQFAGSIQQSSNDRQSFLQEVDQFCDSSIIVANYIKTIATAVLGVVPRQPLNHCSNWQMNYHWGPIFILKLNSGRKSISSDCNYVIGIILTAKLLQTEDFLKRHHIIRSNIIYSLHNSWTPSVTDQLQARSYPNTHVIFLFSCGQTHWTLNTKSLSW